LKLEVVHRSVDPARLAALAGLPSVLARAYAARGIEEPAQLAHSLDRLLRVGSLDGVAAAVDLLLAHRRVGGRVLVVGDFDADGATSSALIVRALQAWGWPAVDFLVPNRFEYGYGLTPEIVALAAERAPTLIVTVDNGISSISGVAAACARHRGAGDGPSPRRRRVAGRQRDRQSKRTGCHLRLTLSRWCRRRVLRDVRAASRAR
jgi:single-stranded-DNA-specific exonuclease